MEKVLCSDHGDICMLKTGVKDGPSKGKSFYVCVNVQSCNFSQPTSLPPSHCIIHEDSVVEIQAISFNQKHQNHRLYFRCIVGKKSGQKWCGSVPWTTQEKENRTPLLSTQLQSSCIPPVRNPFKAPGKMYKDSEWKKMEITGCKENEKKNTEPCHTVEGEESCQKESAEDLSTYQGKTLPKGMKIKKKTPKDFIEKTTGVITVETEKKHEGAHHMTSTSSTEVQPDKINQISSDVHKSLQISDKASPGKQTDLSVQKSVAESESSKGSHASSPNLLNILDEGSDESRSHPHEIDDDVVFVSEQPASKKTPLTSVIQKPITNFPGFQCVATLGGLKEKQNLLSAQLKQKKTTLSAINVAALPDKGEKLLIQIKELEDELESLSLSAASQPESVDKSRESHKGTNFHNGPFDRQGGSIFLPAPPAPGPPQNQAAGSSLGLQHQQMPAQAYGDDHMQAFYGGRMTYHRLLAVKNATSEAIDHLHKSLESCPDPETEVPDPKGIKVPLMPHQRRALAWLLWREKQEPCGGILADDMGLGKTLTVISLILAKKMNAKKEAKEVDQTKSWVSRSDSSIVSSEGTLIICPASLIHHWKMEIDKRVKTCRLTVHLYHGTNRQKSAKVLADYDVVVTTYNLVSKEIQVQKEDANNPCKDPDSEASCSSPLLRVRWARVILDEAHNIKNPKVQTSMAVCQLRAQARWAITGTPIQNNLLDMYSLLKFLRCSPFDEYKLWKAQVDNGSNRGRERLNILMRTLLLRRTKDQLDSTGKPLVSLPNRSCEVHQLHLSDDEQAVYNVVFAQSRSTLQNYLKRHEAKDMDAGKASSSNPFDKVAQEFGLSLSDPAASSSQQHQQSSSSIHILSLLLRLRQCCCHLSLLKKTMDSSELQGDGIVLSLEEQLNALTLSSSPSPSDADPKDTVLLNGSRFSSQLFEDTTKSTKISAITSELKAIKEKSDNQKSVIVSQWTSMLSIVAVHLRQMGLTFGVIDGSVNPKRRMDLVEEFNTNPKGPQVMLVSLCAGGVGLNLIGGNHLFLIDMHWNPALEDQACDRIYRVGQSKDVTIHRFVCEGTVEEKISILQTRKKELAQNVLSGTGNAFSKLSLADLKIIFGV